MNISGKQKNTLFLHLFTCPTVVLFKCKCRNGHFSLKDLRDKRTDKWVSFQSSSISTKVTDTRGERREGRKDKDAIHSALKRGCYGYSRRPTGPAGRQTRLSWLTGGDEGVGR